MKIAFERLPSYSVLLAAFVPWISGATDSNVPVHLFNLLLICITALWLAVNPKPQLRAHLTSWMFSICFCFGLVIAFILHRIHPLTDFLVVVPLTLAYTLLLRNSPLISGELVRQLRWLYSFHIGFIIFELLMFYFDARSVFDILSGGRYRELTFHILSRIVPDVGNGGPNSLLLQAQAASHLVGCAIFIIYFASDDKRRVNPFALTFLLLLFLLVITNTSLLVFLLLGFAAWMIKINLNSIRTAALLITAFLGLVFLDETASVLLYRASEGAASEKDYFWYFTVPISNLLEAQPMRLLFGHGKTTDTLESGELGFATVAFIGGVYLVSLLFAWAASILVVGLIRYKNAKEACNSMIADWRSLLFLNILLCAAWAISTVHYTIVLIPGGAHLFAFSLAIVIIASDRVRALSQQHTRRELTAKQPPPNLSEGLLVG